MSLAYRIWRAARRQLLLRLGMVQGAAFRERPSAQPRPTSPRPRHPCEAEYLLLGAPVGADPVTLRHCWRAQVRLYHPDRYANSPAAQAHAADRLRRANEAYRRIRLWSERRT